MPIEFERDAGNVAVFRISGELGKEELGKAQSECEELIKTAGSVPNSLTATWARIPESR